jgi:hypothetical protein
MAHIQMEEVSRILLRELDYQICAGGVVDAGCQANNDRSQISEGTLVNLPDVLDRLIKAESLCDSTSSNEGHDCSVDTLKLTIVGAGSVGDQTPTDTFVGVLEIHGSLDFWPAEDTNFHVELEACLTSQETNLFIQWYMSLLCAHMFLSNLSRLHRSFTLFALMCGSCPKDPVQRETTVANICNAAGANLDFSKSGWTLGGVQVEREKETYATNPISYSGWLM